MLQELFIRNFALIEEMRLSFDRGLTILTGETGAGKSIILDALSLIVGGRASSDVVRQGAEKAIVEALFLLEEEDTAWTSLLHESGLAEEDGTLIITREVGATGKNVCRINGRVVTLQLLRTLGRHLLDLVGQHENQLLLRGEEQLALLDAFAGDEVAQLRERVASLYHAYNDARQAWQRACAGEKERMQRIDLLRFQVEEIAAARLTPGEEEKLEEERRKLAHTEKLFAATAKAYVSLYQGTGRDAAVLDRLHQAIQELSATISYDETLAPVVEMLQTAGYQIEEASHELRAYRDSLESNPDRLQELEERLTLIARLRKKYGENTQDILQYAKRIQRELYDLEHHEEHLARLREKAERAGKELAQYAIQLSQKRKQAAQDLAELVMGELADLMMPKTQFAVSFQEYTEEDGIPLGHRHVHVSETGIDRVEFLFSSNLGEPLRPLAKIASGGELSRTLLALTTILSHVAGVPTLVFDEVDAGISGRAAQAVAEKLSAIAGRKQVICVTHLPQVACMADTHYHIVKKQAGQRTYTEVYALNEGGRVEELARMLSGAELTATTRKAAEEMLRLARSLKAGEGKTG